MPGDVVGMAVGEDEEVELPDPLAQALQPEFRRGVHLDVEPVHHDVDRGPGAAVARVRRGADRARAGDHGHALGSAGAEENHFHMGGHTIAPPRRAPWRPKKGAPSVGQGRL